MKTLVIAAHPDDEVLGCGGFISDNARSGIETHVLILTDGSGGRYDTETASHHMTNCQRANDLMGVSSLLFANFPNQAMETVPILEINQAIEKHIKAIQPEIVLTHWRGDLNRDHKVAYETTMVATRPYPGQCVKKVYSYYVPSSSEWNMTIGERFQADTFIDITSSIQSKIDAFKHYDTETRPYPHPRSLEALKNTAAFWGSTVGFEYAEPYKLIRNCKGIL